MNAKGIGIMEMKIIRINSINKRKKTFKIITFSNTLNVFPSNILHKYIKDHVEN
jgi:hypothetical protein